MPETKLPSPSSPPTSSGDNLPEVMLEVGDNQHRSTMYHVAEAGFLIGTVPGCDLRLPGSDWPAVSCMISRHPFGATFRKLSPTQQISVNGKSVSTGVLGNGDRIKIGPMEMRVQINSPASGPVKILQPGAPTSAQSQIAPGAEAAKEKLQQQIRQFREQVIRFDEQRAQMEAEALAKKKELEQAAEDLERRQKAVAEAEAAAAAKEKSHLPFAEELQRELAQKQQECESQKQELATQRQELSDIRTQLYDRYRERRDRLACMQEAVNKAARKVQERKQQFDAEVRGWEERRREDAQRKAALDAQAADLDQARSLFAEERRVHESRMEELQSECERRLAECRQHDTEVATDRAALQADQARHKEDLLRLDRQRAEIAERNKEIDERLRDLDERNRQLHVHTQEMEGQVIQLDEWHVKLTAVGEKLAAQKAEQDQVSQQLGQRTAAIEGQQAALAALRTRLERMREEVRQQEQQLSEQRARQAGTEQGLERKREEFRVQREELDAERMVFDQERRALTDRSAVLDAAVAQLRQAQERQSAEEEELRQRTAAHDAAMAVQTEASSLLQARMAQYDELHKRLDAERESLRERSLLLTQAEQAREALQEQLRRRSEELNARQKALTEQAAQYETATADIERERQAMAEAENARNQELAAEREQLVERAAEVDRQLAELATKSEGIERDRARLAEEQRALADQSQEFVDQRSKFDSARRAAEETAARTKAEFEAARREAQALRQQLPELELRAGTALERLTHAREQVRDQLDEVHAYANQCRDDLDAVRGQVQGEAERIQRQEQYIRRQQDEQRLAVAAFRQQLIDWQGQISDMKRLLAHDETRLEQRSAEVNEQARQLGADTARLAQQADELQSKEREIAEKHAEVDRHLIDMREWYRRKLRELAGIRDAESDSIPPPQTEPDSEHGGRDILSLTGDVDPIDRKLGDLMTSLELIEADTLTALLVEARRQRRSLRQVLLASGVVTLYQMALIEAGNLEGLMMGPVRIVDRMQSTQREAAYRVFDPRRGTEAILRRLAEAEAQDAAHAADFRDSFSKAMLTHPNLTSTWEVLDVAERPAVLQEWLVGLASGDWPPLAVVPGAWYRLVLQAAQALSAIHEAGLVHGHLQHQHFVLTGSGVLKISGLGEPAWLVGTEFTATAADDLTALGKIAAEWVAAAQRKGARGKPLPGPLQKIMDKLGSGRYQTAAQLLDELGHCAGAIPVNPEAWDRLLRHVRENATPPLALRESA
jgi:chromosome segregation ATPase